MKHGSIGETGQLIDLAHELGLGVVLGNGDQADLGCFDEAFLYQTATLTHAGELNGFLKHDQSLTIPPARGGRGVGHFPAGPAIDHESLRRCTIAYFDGEDYSV